MTNSVENQEQIFRNRVKLDMSAKLVRLSELELKIQKPRKIRQKLMKCTVIDARWDITAETEQ